MLKQPRDLITNLHLIFVKQFEVTLQVQAHLPMLKMKQGPDEGDQLTR